MARALRHVIIGDHHNRIPLMKEKGLDNIAQASTVMLTDAIKQLSRYLILSDEQWCVWYALKDELIERGEWSEELTKVSR